MNYLVVLKFGNGSMRSGFPSITMQIGEDGGQYQKQITASLPGAPELIELFRNWQVFYQANYDRLGWRFRITFDDSEATITNVSSADFESICQRLRDSLNDWLDSEKFRPISKEIWQSLKKDTPIRVLIETNDPFLRQFPWQIWNFFQEYPLAELALSNPDHALVKPKTQNNSGKVRIMAVFGNSQGLDLQHDQAILKKLPHAQSKFLCSPSRRSITDEMWRNNYDIFFFAGHSSSEIEEETGKIGLAENQNLTIADLKNALSRAIEGGLQLAIFNSCEGLGLVSELNKLNLYIPQLIVMREPVPDKVAQMFLTYFLEAFSQQKSLYLAVREAKERLQSLEDEFPCASWLPVICQNPVASPPTWKSLRGVKGRLPIPALWTTLAVTTLIIFMRSLGVLQGMELAAFDRMLRLKPSEPVDSRLLVVEASENDINKYGFPLPDATLSQALEKLEEYQPRVVGLDIYRPSPKDAKFAQQIKENQNLVPVCELSEGDEVGVSAPPGIPVGRQSFSDIAVDGDGVVRRHLIAVTPAPNSNCKAELSFSLQLAVKYLLRQGISSPPTYVLQFKDKIFPKLKPQTGGYQQLDARGYQILLNYRFPEVARSVKLSDVLDNKVDPSWVKDKAVLIGVTAPSAKDLFPTPYSTAGRSHAEKPGVIVHAQQLSQILSAVIDNRSTIWVWEPLYEGFWIACWGLIGGIIGWRSRTVIYFLCAAGVAAIALFGICFIFFLQGGWLPILPSAIALVFAGACVAFYMNGKLV